MTAFLLMLREGLEAALIVGILLAYVRRIDAGREARWIWAGTGSAAAVSVAAGIVVWATIGSLEGRAEEISEGVVAFVAAGLLTWMIVWMGGRARTISAHLQSKVDAAFATGGAVGLAAIAFFAVLREGLESALFLISTTIGEGADGWQFLGGGAGLALAVGIGYLIYRGGTRIDIRLFFRFTGVLIILFAAGLVSKGIHEFQEAALLPVLYEPLWDAGILHPDTSIVGRFAASLFGWTPAPSLLMVAGYLAYLVPVGTAFSRMTARRPAQEPQGASVAGG